MRVLKSVLAVIILTAGMAEARWYWAVNQCLYAPGYNIWTGSNAARCIAGIGDDIHVVYARSPVGYQDKVAWHVWATNLGLYGWRTAVQLTEENYPFTSHSPSIGMFSRETLMAVTNDSGHDDYDHYGMIRVVSRVSEDTGKSWLEIKHVSQEEGTEFVMHPALAVAESIGPSGRLKIANGAFARTIWNGNNPFIRHNDYPDRTYPDEWSDQELDFPGQHPNDLAGQVAVWNLDTFRFAAYEKRVDGIDSIKQAHWEHGRLVIEEPAIDTGGYPSIAFDSLYETVAYVQYLNGTSTVRIARRADPFGEEPGDWDFTTYSPPGSYTRSLRPSLFATHRGTDGWTYMALTGSSSSGVKSTYFVASTDGGANWFSPMPANSTHDTGTDSVSVWAQDFGPSQRAVDPRRRVWLAAICHPGQDAIRVRVASEYAVPPTPDVALAHGSGQVVRQPGTDYIHRASRLDTYINYERSDDNGETWDFQDAPDFGTNPTLALYNGNPIICYLRNDSVFSARMNSDSEWTIKTIFAGTSTYRPGVPSLAVFQNAGAGTRMANACFPVYDNTGTGSLILLAQFDTAASGGVVLDTIDSNANSKADSAVTVAVGLNDTIEVCFEYGDSIYYKYLQYSPTDGNQPGAWTKYTLVNTGNTNAQHPYAEKVGDRFYVTFSEHWNPGAQTVWAIKRTSCCDTATAVTWEGTVSVSNEDAALKDFPSMSTGMVVAWAESSSTTTHWVIETRCGDSLLTLTDPDTNCKFVSICADTAVQTSPSTSTTGIYYLWLQQYSGDTWQVPYASKQVLTSDADANVTMYNQGRKLALDDNDTLHAVYRTDQGSLYYGKKKDGVEGWTSSLLRSTGDMPAVDDDYLNRVYVADRDFQSGAGTYDVVRCQTRAAGSGSWTDFQVYSSMVAGGGATVHKIGPPAIVACINDTDGQNRSAAYIVFTVYEPGMMFNTSTVCMAKVDTTGVVYVDTLRWVQGYNDSYPSIALHPVAGLGYDVDASWQEGTEIYVKKTLDQDQPQYTTKRTWSSNYNLSNTAANSRHPQIVAADTVLVAWVEGDSGAVYVKGQAPGSDYDAWDAPVNVSACPDTVCDYPSIALGDSNIVTYQKKLSSTNYDVIARVNFHSNLNLSNSTTNSKYPHCVFHLHKDSFPVISTVWTEELSTNYAEVAYKRWQLGEADGGGIQNAGFLDPNIHPCLFAPRPNPFNGMTSIRYQTNITGLTRVTVMDVTGRRVRNLLTMPQNPGIYTLTWNARDDRERQLPRGVYFVRLETTNYHEARKVIIQ